MADQNFTTTPNMDPETICERARSLLFVTIDKLHRDPDSEHLATTLETAYDLIGEIGPHIDGLNDEVHRHMMAYPLAYEAPASREGEIYADDWNPRLREFIDGTAKAIGQEAEAKAREQLTRLASERVNYSTCDSVVEWISGYIGSSKPLLFTRYDMKLLSMFLQMTKENISSLEEQLDRAKLEHFGESAAEYDASNQQL